VHTHEHTSSLSRTLSRTRITLESMWRAQAARADIILRVKAQELALASHGCFPTAALDSEAGMESRVEPWQETAKAGDGGRQARRLTDCLSVPTALSLCFYLCHAHFIRLLAHTSHLSSYAISFSTFDPALSVLFLALNLNTHSLPSFANLYFANGSPEVSRWSCRARACTETSAPAYSRVLTTCCPRIIGWSGHCGRLMFAAGDVGRAEASGAGYG
jgi:hypothetical protein